MDRLQLDKLHDSYARQIDQLTAERDALRKQLEAERAALQTPNSLVEEYKRLTAERDAWKERHARLDRESVDAVSRIAQERDALRAERDALEWAAERKSIAGAQLFHDLQANVECLQTNVESLRAELLAEYAKGHRAGYAAGSESLLRDPCDHPRQSCEEVGCRAPIEQRLKTQLRELHETAAVAVDCVDEEDKRDALRAVLTKQQRSGVKWT